MATIYEICEAKATAGEETWYTLESLGLASPVRERALAQTDSLTLEASSQTAFTDSAGIFTYKKQIRFRKTENGTSTLLFLGRVKPIQRAGEGSGEGFSIRIAGPWDWLENTPMRQAWVEGSLPVVKPRVVLFCSDTGNRITTGAQIKACIEAAVEAGCPIATPNETDIDTGFCPPFDEQINISIANAITKALTNHPHACCWFDYSERNPRFYCKTRNSLSNVAYSIDGHSGIRITAREDIQPTAVAICYEKDNTVDGKTYRQTTVDYAPIVPGETEAQRRTRLMQTDVLWGVFDLQGSSMQRTSQEIVCEALPSNWATNLSWWKAQIPRLAESEISVALIAGTSSRSGALGLSYVLKEGAIQQWMDCDAERETFKVRARISRYVGGELIETASELLSVELSMVDSDSDTFTTTTSYDSGESIPSGIASTMWTEWSQLHHEGLLTLVEQECSCAIGPGKTLSLTGGLPAWSSMAAMVCRVSEDFDEGTTDIEFGIPGWIDLDSRVAWYRNCRTRRYSYSRKLKEAPEGDEGIGGLSQTSDVRDEADARECFRKRFFDPSASVRHIIDLWAQGTSGGFEFATPGDGSTARTIRPKEMYLAYDDNGTLKAKKCQVLCSEGYGTAKDLGGGGEKVKADANDPTADYLSGKVEYSIAVDTTNHKLKLVGDSNAPGNYCVYCTDAIGFKSWRQGVLVDL